MKTRAILALTAVAGLAAVANAQNNGNGALSFAIGNNNLAPGQSTTVTVSATFNAVGSTLPWTTNGGTGQMGTVNGFNSAVFGVTGAGTGSGTWSNLTLGPGLVAPPFGNPGVIAGMNVGNINAGVGFGAPIANQPVVLWTGTFTAGNLGVVNLATAFVAVGSPPNGPYQGLEIALGGIVPGLNVTHYINTTNASGAITIVPAPASLALLGLGGLVAARRRR